MRRRSASKEDAGVIANLHSTRFFGYVKRIGHT